MSEDYVLTVLKNLLEILKEIKDELQCLKVVTAVINDLLEEPASMEESESTDEDFGN